LYTAHVRTTLIVVLAGPTVAPVPFANTKPVVSSKEAEIGQIDIPLIVRPTVPGQLDTTGFVFANGTGATVGPANTTINVVRTCAVYNGDGSAFPCGDGAVANANNSQSTSPSTATCCVSS
jgi:hypothetical protein